MSEPLFHGFPRTNAGRAAAREWLSSGGNHEESLRKFYEKHTDAAACVTEAAARKFRGRPNKHGVRGLSYSVPNKVWVGEFYEKGHRKTFRNPDKGVVTDWLVACNLSRLA